ncbi:MAG: glycosyltransferase family 4 protein, partial [Bdellovibrionales bacterium]|nr:glycosyltransferase family 4 protein [Bdellovibrionales bacterium]
GRKETGKNVQVLIDFFMAGKDAGLLPEDLHLVIGGGGSFTDLLRPQAVGRPDIIDLPRLSEREKHQAMKHSLAVVQPSLNESFSIVIMEAWLLGTAVMVHSQCAVTRDHVVRSGGGLYFSGEDDFIGATQFLISDPEARRELAEAGFQYVKTRYAWDAVLDRFDSVVGELLAA